MHILTSAMLESPHWLGTGPKRLPCEEFDFVGRCAYQPSWCTAADAICCFRPGQKRRLISNRLIWFFIHSDTVSFTMRRSKLDLFVCANLRLISVTHHPTMLMLARTPVMPYLGSVRRNTYYHYVRFGDSVTAGTYGIHTGSEPKGSI